MEGDYIVGRNPISEALKSNREIDKIFVLKGELKGSINKIIGEAKDRHIPIQYVERGKLDGISGSIPHQGVAALVSSYAYSTVDDILNASAEKSEEPFIIILDGIEDSHNLGAIIRTAEAGGAHGIIIPKHRSATLTQAVAKASAGAIEWIKVARETNISATIQYLKKKGLWIFGADMAGENYYYETDLKGPIALVIGSEGKGLSRLVKENCDFLIKIPMVGHISSLNASNAVSVLIYEVVRQRSLKNEKR